MPEPDTSSKPITALGELRAVLDQAPNVLKQEISRIKKLLAEPQAESAAAANAYTPADAKGALDRLALQARQLRRWQNEEISDAERAEVTRLQAVIPEIRPLIQRLIALATELDKRAKTGSASRRKRWRH